MAALDDFFPGIRQNINGPLEIMMRSSVLKAARTFCRESLVVRQTIELDDVAVGQQVTLTAADDLVKCVKRLQVYDLSPQLVRPECDPVVLKAGIDFTVQSANQLTFVKAYGKALIVFAIEPKPDATEVPDVLLDDYSDVIAYGALEDLYLMPHKPWSDPQMSQYFRRFFIDGYRRAFRDALDNSPITAFYNPTRKHEFM
jgi:hypothetical protein